MGQEQRAYVVRSLPTGRVFAVDERDVALRLTWRLDRGFINLSLWRDDRCVETFHLTPADASRVVSFIVSGLAETATTGPAASISHLQPIRSERVHQQLRDVERRARIRVAGLLTALARAVHGEDPR